MKKYRLPRKEKKKLYKSLVGRLLYKAKRNPERFESFISYGIGTWYKGPSLLSMLTSNSEGGGTEYNWDNV